MPRKKIQYRTKTNATQGDTIQHAIAYNNYNMRWKAIKYKTKQHNLMPYNAIQYNMQYHIIQYTTTINTIGYNITHTHTRCHAMNTIQSNKQCHTKTMKSNSACTVQHNRVEYYSLQFIVYCPSLPSFKSSPTTEDIDMILMNGCDRRTRSKYLSAQDSNPLSLPNCLINKVLNKLF